MSFRYKGGVVSANYNALGNNSTTSTYIKNSGNFTTSDQASAVATGEWNTDPYSNYVIMLIQADNRANGAQNNTFIDSSANNYGITRNGDVTQGTLSPYMPASNWSILCNPFQGAGASFTLPSTGTGTVTTGDYTYEFWAYKIAQTNTLMCVSTGTSLTLMCRVDSTGSAGITMSAGGGVITPTQGNHFLYGRNGTWFHFAVVRQSGTFYVYVNGVAAVIETGNTTGFTFNGGSSGNRAIIGAYPNSGNQEWIGYVSNYRIVNGTAIYRDGKTFEVPTEPLTAVTNTIGLYGNMNRIRDSSVSNAALGFNTTGGSNCYPVPFGPFKRQGSVEDVTRYGGSIYFSGVSPTCLRVFDGNASAVGTGDLTVEFWMQSTRALWTTAAFDILQGNTNAMFLSVNASGVLNVTRKLSGTNYSLGNLNSGTINPRNWNHFVIVRQSGSMRAYVNGSPLAAAVSVTENFTAASTFIGGTTDGTGLFFQGYMADLRFTKSALYSVSSSSITVPTAPVGPGTSSYYLQGINAGIYDATGLNTFTTVGTAQVSTSVKKYGSGSLYFDGTSGWLTVPNSSENTLGQAAFTIEGWFYLTTLGAVRSFISKGTASTGWSVGVTSSNQLAFYYTATTLTAGAPVVANTWYHFAVVRVAQSSAGNIKMYLNGVRLNQINTVNDNFNQTDTLYVGASRVGGTPMLGYLDEIRITRGIARYPDDFFVPPRVGFPPQ